MLRILLLLTLVFQPLLASAESETADPKASPAYADAQIMAKCSGYYNFLAVIYQSQHNRSNTKGALAQSDNWRVATKGALYAAGFKRVKVIVMSDGMVDAERERLMTLMKSTPKHVTEDLDASLKVCGDNLEAQAQYIKQMETM